MNAFHNHQSHPDGAHPAEGAVEDRPAGKLLKDKRDELMKQFMDVVRENRALRRRVEEGLMRAHASFTVASALMSPEILEQSLLCPKQSVELEMTFQNVMSVDVPRYQFQTKSQDPGEVYPYGFAQTSGELDDAVDALSRVLCFRICSSWRRSKRPASSWPRRLKRPAAG